MKPDKSRGKPPRKATATGIGGFPATVGEVGSMSGLTTRREVAKNLTDTGGIGQVTLHSDCKCERGRDGNTRG